ncbi:15722_t:CDS:2 [Funneliformis mosseae]|uniref:15722_t:CDS:1 n=1 Tax=Funneliformis mosseae TaxID=27381 RepID=A0A9N9HCZ5_FUNMO|nr:15722_t:CDS:2 [Funneliformis mosseae]
MAFQTGFGFFETAFQMGMFWFLSDSILNGYVDFFGLDFEWTFGPVLDFIEGTLNWYVSFFGECLD